MKFFKHIAPIIALCNIHMLQTKGLKQTGTTAPRPITTPNRTNQPARQSQPLPQPQRGPRQEYANILDQLQKMQPTTDDFNALVAIQTEVNNQIVKAKYPKKVHQQAQILMPGDKVFAKMLFENDRINLNKTQAECDIASKNDADIFTGDEINQIIPAINKIVTDFIGKRADIDKETIYEAIISMHPDFLKLKNKLTQAQYDEITTFIKNAVDKEWVYVNAAKFDV